MIGFDDEIERPGPHADEGPETSNIEKPALYSMVNGLYCIPPYGSRGTKRKYLVAVHHGQVFRVSHSELRHFEVDLHTSRTKKLGTVNNGLLVRKLNLLLRSRGQKELGFSEFEPPEQVERAHQTWLHRVARYIDPSNLTEFFEMPVITEPSLHSKSSLISLVYHARRRAYRYLIEAKQAKSNKRFWESLREISDNYREYQNQDFMVAQLQKEVERAQEKTARMRVDLEDKISKVVFSYVTLKNPAITSTMIFKSSQSQDPAVQKEAADAYRL